MRMDVGGVSCMGVEGFNSVRVYGGGWSFKMMGG